MKTKQARAEARRRWGDINEPRFGFVIQRRKNHPKRCVVGYHVVGPRGGDHIRGRGDTWEEAFADAAAAAAASPASSKAGQ